MRTVAAVLHPVLLSQQAGFRHRGEQLDIQGFIPELTIE
jgi:hypothetical protein